MTNRTRSRSAVTRWQQAPRNARQERNNALRDVTREGSVVYAIRRGDGIIKIGITADLNTRARQLGGTILALKYGDFADEQEMHRRLAGHRAHGREYYYPTPVVLAAVNEMRADLGLDALES